MGQLSISQIRHLIRSLSYVVSNHAAEELEDDNLTILDFENIILTGEITARQRDQKSEEIKYVVQGTTLDGFAAEVVVKAFGESKLFVITAYVL